MLRIFIVATLCIVRVGFSQETSSWISYDYGMLYNSNSTSLNKNHFDAIVKDSVKIMESKYSFNFSNYTLQYHNAIESNYNTDPLENLSSIRIGYSYKRNINSNWKSIFSLQPELTFNDFNSISFQNLYFNPFIGFEKKMEGFKKAMLAFGFGYTTLLGKPRFLPQISYSRDISQKWSYSIGFPNNNVLYKINKNQTLKSEVGINAIYSRVGHDNTLLELEHHVKREAVEIQNINLSFQYHYISNENWIGNIKMGHSLYNNITVYHEDSLQDKIDFKNTFYFSIGFIYNINFK